MQTPQLTAAQLKSIIKRTDNKEEKAYRITAKDIAESGETKTCLDKVHTFVWGVSPENHADVETAMESYLAEKSQTNKEYLITELEAQQRGLELVCMFQGIRMHNPEYSDDDKEHYNEFEELLDDTNKLITLLTRKTH